jgi:hypothetical protein
MKYQYKQFGFRKHGWSDVTNYLNYYGSKGWKFVCWSEYGAGDGIFEKELTQDDIEREAIDSLTQA